MEGKNMDINFGLFRNLKPVELLYLLSQADEEYFDDESSLRAVLAFFFQQGYIIQEKSGRRVDLVITMEGLEAIARGDLREYEVDILKIIKNRGDDSQILRIIKDLGPDLLDYFIKTRFLVKETRPFLFFFERERVVKTKKTINLVGDLYSLRNDLASILKEGRMFTGYHLSFMPIFPGILDSEEFMEYIKSGDNNEDLMNAISWSERICNGWPHVIESAHSFTV
jgi:hypothetical protein